VKVEALFWHKCWQRDHIGFHQQEYHSLLTELWQQCLAWQPTPVGSAQTSGEGALVFVPLCGKSADMLYIAKRQKVIGAELSEIACRDFFAENYIACQSRQQSRFVFYHSESIELYQGDFFALQPQDLSGCRLIYDRAALIALPPALRVRYVAQLRSLIVAGSKLLLLTVEFDGDSLKGPPFSVFEDEVRQLFDGCIVDKVAVRPLDDQRFAQRKLLVTSLQEVAYFVYFPA
jgi:thiopurine S-methyltransferase